MKKGRPPRGRYEATRIKIWSLAVYLEAIAKKTTVESLLGYDGKWASLWARYCRGLVAPSESRLNRIEHVLKNTAHYYRSPLWRSYSPRKWNRLELEFAIQKLDPSFRYAMRPKNGEYDDSHYWNATDSEEDADTETEEDNEEDDVVDEDDAAKMRVYFGKVLVNALENISDPQLGMSAISAIYLMLQEQRMLGKVRHFKILCLAWADAEIRRHQHPLLKHLPIDVFHQPVAPLLEYLSSTILEFIRENRNLRRNDSIHPSDIFWFLQTFPDWKEHAKAASLMRRSTWRLNI